MNQNHVGLIIEKENIMYKLGDPVDYIFMGKKYTGNIIDLGNSRLVPNYFKLDKLHNGKNRINANDVIPSPIAKIQDMRESADRLAETLKQASELKWTKGFQFGYKRACEEVLELLGGK